MKAVVTGATGFIGKSVVDELINNNVDVISQRDWFAIANIKSNICYFGDMIDILKDLIKIIK